jgi:hypothetical protein
VRIPATRRKMATLARTVGRSLDQISSIHLKQLKKWRDWLKCPKDNNRDLTPTLYRYLQALYH